MLKLENENEIGLDGGFCVVVLVLFRIFGKDSLGGGGRLEFLFIVLFFRVRGGR